VGLGGGEEGGDVGRCCGCGVEEEGRVGKGTGQGGEGDGLLGVGGWVACCPGWCEVGR
jgi:hypothetical protein